MGHPSVRTGVCFSGPVVQPGGRGKSKLTQQGYLSQMFVPNSYFRFPSSANPASLSLSQSPPPPTILTLGLQSSEEFRPPASLSREGDSYVLEPLCPTIQGLKIREVDLDILFFVFCFLFYSAGIPIKLTYSVPATMVFVFLQQKGIER
jgi:hypothetical protein